QITEKAKVAKGTYFNYFPTKEAIIEELAEEKYDELKAYAEHFIQSQQFSLPLKIKNFLSYMFRTERFQQPLEDKILLCLIKKEKFMLSIWQNMLKQAANQGEIPKNIDFFLWSHIFN